MTERPSGADERAIEANERPINADERAIDAARTPSSRVDWIQLKALLRAYMKMAASGASLIRARGKPTPLAYVLVMYTFLGLMIGLGALIHPGVLLYSIALHSLTLFVVGMSAVIESNDVLFDPKEDEILMHRPIPPGTLLAAKALALVGFTSLLAAAVNLFPTFFLLAAKDAKPWLPLVHLLSIGLLVVFVCAAVVCCYGLILRIFGREKFESLAVFAQVGLTLLFVGGVQVIPRLVERVGPERLDEIAHYLLFSPPAWFAAIDASLGGPERGASTLLAAGAGIVATALLCWIGIGKLSSGYGVLIPSRGTVPGAEARAAEGTEEGKRGRADDRPWRSSHPLLGRWLRDPIEWSTFRLAIAYIRRDREVKLRVYSSLSSFLVFVVLSLVGGHRSDAQFFPLMMLAMAGTVPLTVMESMRMSNHYAAAELFHAAPLESASSLFHGVRKAIVVFVQLPIVVAALLLIAFRSRATDMNLLLAIPTLIALPTLSLAPGILKSYVPLSMEPRRGRQSAQNVAAVLMTMLVAGGMMGLSYLAWSLGYLWIFVAVEIAGVAVAHGLLLGVIRRRRLVSWAEE